jgi:hypothetical protein
LEERRERERGRPPGLSSGSWFVPGTGSDPECVPAGGRPSPSKNADDDLVIRPGECERAPCRNDVVSIDGDLLSFGGLLPLDVSWREGISGRCGGCEENTPPPDGDGG